MKILDRVPITEDHTSLRFGDRFLKIRPNQILVWVSVHMAGPFEPEGNIPKFPALLDIGNNFGLSMQHRRLRDWAGIDPALLVALGKFSIDEKIITRRKARVWVHPNMPGRRDIAVNGRPFQLNMPRGIGVYPPEADPPGPRLPLLGLPALLDSDLDCWLDPERRRVTVRTRTWRRRVIRLLSGA